MRKEKERIMAVIKYGRTGDDLSGAEAGAGERRFCGAHEGRNGAPLLVV